MTAGDFTPWERCKTSLKENALIYGSLLVLAGAFLIYIVVKNNLTTHVPRSLCHR